MAGFVGGAAEGAREAVHGVAVDTVGADLGEEFGGGVPVGHAFIAGALIPDHNREEDTDVVLVEVVDHGADGRDAAGQGAEEIVLVAVVDADVGIALPEENGVYAAE